MSHETPGFNLDNGMSAEEKRKLSKKKREKQVQREVYEFGKTDYMKDTSKSYDSLIIDKVNTAGNIQQDANEENLYRAAVDHQIIYERANLGRRTSKDQADLDAAGKKLMEADDLLKQGQKGKK